LGLPAGAPVCGAAQAKDASAKTIVPPNNFFIFYISFLIESGLLGRPRNPRIRQKRLDAHRPVTGGRTHRRHESGLRLD
jgi:hypothetical protein